MKKSILLVSIAILMLFAVASQAAVLFYENFADPTAAAARFGWQMGAEYGWPGATVDYSNGLQFRCYQGLAALAWTLPGAFVDDGSPIAYFVNEREYTEAGSGAMANAAKFYFRTAGNGNSDGYYIGRYWDGVNEAFTINRMVSGASTELFNEFNQMPSNKTASVDWVITLINTASSVDISVSANGNVIQTVSDTSDQRILTGSGLGFRFDNGGTADWLGCRFYEVKVAGVPGSIEGTVNLSDFVGDRTLAPVRIDVMNAGTGVIAKSAKLTLDETGAYQIPSLDAGMYDVSFSANKWLRKVVYGVEVVGGQVTPVSVDLLNGDIDGDNEVTSTDLSILGLNLGIAGD